MDRETIQKTVYLIRHGESLHNTAPVFQGVDPPLSERGQAQAMAVSNRMTTLHFDSLISSPLPRAAQTAQYIADKTGRKIIFSDLLVECKKPTAILGKPYADATASMLWQAWQSSLQAKGPKVEDGETYEEFVARVDAALAYLLDRPEDVLVVVTHGHLLRAMVARVLYGEAMTPDLLDRFYRRVSIGNTGITVLRYKDGFEEESGWHLWTLNDSSHFAE